MAFVFFVAMGATLIAGFGMFEITRVVYAAASGRHRARAFDVRRVPLGIELAARVAASAAPFAVPALLLWISLAIDGTKMSTNRVEVLEGPAKSAGVRDGDRIVGVDGKTTNTWVEVRTAVQAGHRDGKAGNEPEQRVLRVERAGALMDIPVTPDSEGHVRMNAIEQTQAIPLFTAAKEAIALTFRVVGEALAALGPHGEAEFRGPVGIVRSTKKDRGPGYAAMLFFVGILGSRYALVIALAHFGDAALLRLFLILNPAAAATDEANQPYWRVARMRQLLLGGIAAVFALMILIALADHMDLSSAAVAQSLIFPVVLPATWVLAREMSGRGLAVFSVVVLCVPVLNLFLLWWLSAKSKPFLLNHGLRPAWLRVIQTHEQD